MTQTNSPPLKADPKAGDQETLGVAGNAQPAQVTPMMSQYLAIKAEHPDYLLFYRMGDFYELFFEDAIAAATALDITLTHRGKHLGEDTPMCGVPVHASEGYLHRLIRKGFRVAVCEQMENPAEAKKRGAKSVVRRDVVRLVTPGTLSEDGLLDARSHNFLAAYAVTGDVPSLAWLDMSTGEFWVADLQQQSLASMLARLQPSEILLPETIGTLDDELSTKIYETLPNVTLTFCTPSSTLSELGADLMGKHFPEKDSAAATAEIMDRSNLAACGLLLDYLQTTQISNLPRLRYPQVESGFVYMSLDAATRMNLELIKTQSGERRGSLLSIIDRTMTAAGARLLSAQLSAPLLDPLAINQRLDGISYFYEDLNLTKDIRERLRAAPDIARALSRLAIERGGPRDLAAIAAAISAAEDAQLGLARAQGHLPDGLAFWNQSLSLDLAGLRDLLIAALQDDLPVLARDGGFVRDGYHAGLDSARALRDESRRIIAALQMRYCEETEIKALKIKHNAVLGYHIDVPAAQGDRLMAAPFSETFIHRQTLANAVRFSTQELAGLAGEISRAAETALGIEQSIFADLCAAILALSPALESLSNQLAQLDIAASLADLASEAGWSRPSLFDDTRFVVEGGRHPVVEHALKTQSQTAFISNDCHLTTQTQARLLLLTGPNMAGKSTFLRQNALIAILAQMGSFVPAAKAEIGLVDRVFSRVGAADDLARGRSTFMVEMVETAAILKHASPRSFVILDEIGRGTATFDGLSLAWACVEHLHEITGCRTLFATHYHELTALTSRLDHLKNITMRVKEHAGKLVFLHEVGFGAADRSYGIQVAELAGLPETVTSRAKIILQQLEENRAASSSGSTLEGLPLFEVNAVVEAESDAVRDALLAIDPDVLSPREALEWIYRLRKLI